MAVPVGGTPVAPRALGSNKRLGEGVRPAQLIPRSQAKQVTPLYIVFNLHILLSDIWYETKHCYKSYLAFASTTLSILP